MIKSIWKTLFYQTRNMWSMAFKTFRIYQSTTRRWGIHYFIKAIYKMTAVKGRKIKKDSEIHTRKKKTPLKGKFSRIPRKTFLGQLSPFSNNSDDVRN
ncbi:hypothetical protein AVEN_34640-1 [Araneus ventricosus]|uniref:Uncharacterized protein n=1 Tax=Araneus ventricosus TaxID=182803 RepID=A0A4Y2B330_ARAVE|nr:hypothetical protein AVEN_34640-1 [Araneus ventricosus]